MIHSKKYFIGFCVLALLGLSACEALVAGGTVYGYNFFKDPEVNLQAKSYAAADYIIQQTGDFINKDRDVIRMAALVDLDRSNMSAPFNNVIPQQVGERLRQLGYNIDSSIVSVKNAPAQINTRKKRQDYVLTGAYKVHPADVDIALKIVGAQSGHIYGTYNYMLPLTESMRADMLPQAKIYRPATQVRTTPAQ